MSIYKRIQDRMLNLLHLGARTGVSIKQFFRKGRKHKKTMLPYLIAGLMSFPVFLPDRVRAVPYHCRHIPVVFLHGRTQGSCYDSRTRLGERTMSRMLHRFQNSSNFRGILSRPDTWYTEKKSVSVSKILVLK